MDTKKLILAIVLSRGGFAGLPVFFHAQARGPAAGAPERRRGPAAERRAGSRNQGRRRPPTSARSWARANRPSRKSDASLPAVQEDVSAPDEQTVTVDGALFTAVFTNRGAGLTSFVLKKYKDDAKKPMDLVSRSAKESSFYPFYFFSEKDDFSAILNKALFQLPGRDHGAPGRPRSRQRSFLNSPTRPSNL